ncbi:hypothetical protein CVS30_08785 [Arthrobacter psychrolactophilus]|uniref:Uncharacterized protein n=1 Tax=Arthrobacter psychrolactophilus TaxID=92442 RepID=A0A2V5J791_9MICC|nr:hypothetical protein [Arthrobacter psychrolactophilus]PYI38650.1 hypothetical protein CVS30_08785 [Arthrobacter psychrolactophilus]
MNNNDSANTELNQIPAESGYGSPTPEDEMPEGSVTNPGSSDPTLRGQESDELSLRGDESLGAPDRNFFENEDAGSDGEPGAGRLGGTDDQYREELARADDEAVGENPIEPTPLEAPSTDAPLDEGNSGPTRTERESFSSEPDADAAGSS